MNAVTRMLLAGTLAGLVAAPALSAQVNVGSPNTVQPNSYPFGSSVLFSNFQQIYSASLFSGPININAISLYNSRGTGNYQVGTFNLFLSTTTVASTAVTNGNPANNRTGPLAAFATVTYTANTAVPTITTFTGTPYTYNPTDGNLLLEVQFTPNGFNTNPAFFDVVASADAARTQVGTASNRSVIGGTNGRANYGFVTTFTAAPVVDVPEPASLALLTFGLTGLCLVATRRRKGQTTV